jgi:hypothetical protein
MACEKCQNIVDRKDLPHIIRKCENCGRVMYVHEPLKHGKGLKVKKGEQLVIPKDWLSLSLDPLKSRGHFTRYGLNWFAQRIFIEDYPKDKSKIRDELQKIEKKCDAFLSKSTLLSGLDIENPDHTEKIIQILNNKKYSAEWWAFLTCFFLSILKDALERNELDQAIWAMSGVERFRSMFIFKEHLEVATWMGHSAKKVVDILRTWDNNQRNNDEGFWQTTFTENSYVLSQVFAVPLIFIKDKPYVGGMNIDRKESKFVDYLYSIESSKEAVLMEIKTPMTKLLGAKYRGVYKPSEDLTGAFIQVLEYRIKLNDNLKNILDGTKHDISAFNPKCAIIVGNGKLQLDDETKRRSFELFRCNLKDVEAVTYDELFRKVEILASLFKLVRKKTTNQQ